MKQLLGLLLICSTGLFPVTGFSKDNHPDTKGAAMVTVTMETNKGVITLELDSAKAPDSVANFVTYAKAGHYDNTVFHRVIPGFMIQGGGFDTSMQQKSTNAPVKNEANNGLKNDKGTIAMARTSDPHSATAQFFINVKDNTFLDHKSETPQGWGYTVFGKVIEGMDVVELIENIKTTERNGMRNVPSVPVVIKMMCLVD